MGKENDQLYYYHGDHLGSAQIVTDYKGEIYEQLEYTPYRELWVEHLKTTIETTPFRFTGKERDSETGLYYFGARYLNPQTSMWLSADPAMGEYIPQAPVNDEAKKHNENLPGMGGVFNYVNLHTYHYAGNNPVKLKDPDGKTIITNQTANYIILKGEHSETHVVKPGEVFDTSKHGLEAIDGILLPSGSTYKINSGNANSELLVTESNGVWNVEIKKGGLIDALGNIVKSLINGGIYDANAKLLATGLDESELIDPLDLSGMYEKNDPRFESWCDKALGDINRFSSNPNDDWNTKLAEFVQKNPDGVE